MENFIGKIVPFNERLIFIDCETSNLTNKDVCQIGAVVCDNGYITNVINEYVKPLGGFNENSIKKHGITSLTVKNSLTFDKVWNKKFCFVDSSYIFVAHNAEFDLEAITKSLLCYGQRLNKIKYIDTEKIARVLIPNLPKTQLGQYTRENICSYLNIDIQESHNALSDTIDCLNIFCGFIENYVIKINQFISEYDSEKLSRRVSNVDYEKIYANKSRLSREEIAATIVNAECDEDFVGKTVVITGDFSRFPIRKNAELEIRKRGGKTSSSVSSVTNLLVCGGKNVGWKKIELANKFIEQGCNLQIIDEETFYRMLESNEAI